MLQINPHAFCWVYLLFVLMLFGKISKPNSSFKLKVDSDVRDCFVPLNHEHRDCTVVTAGPSRYKKKIISRHKSRNFGRGTAIWNTVKHSFFMQHRPHCSVLFTALTRAAVRTSRSRFPSTLCKVQLKKLHCIMQERPMRMKVLGSSETSVYIKLPTTQRNVL